MAETLDVSTRPLDEHLNGYTSARQPGVYHPATSNTCLPSTVATPIHRPAGTFTSLCDCGLEPSPTRHLDWYASTITAAYDTQTAAVSCTVELAEHTLTWHRCIGLFVHATRLRALTTDDDHPALAVASLDEIDTALARAVGRHFVEQAASLITQARRALAVSELHDRYTRDMVTIDHPDVLCDNWAALERWQGGCREGLSGEALLRRTRGAFGNVIVVFPVGRSCRTQVLAWIAEWEQRSRTLRGLACGPDVVVIFPTTAHVDSVLPEVMVAHPATTGVAYTAIRCDPLAADYTKFGWVPFTFLPAPRRPACGVLGPSDDIDNETLAAFCNLPGPLDADSTAARLYDARVATHTASPHQPPQ